MPDSDETTNSEAGILGDVNLADLASALPIEHEYLEHFKGTANEEVTTKSDSAEVVEEDEETAEATEEVKEETSEETAEETKEESAEEAVEEETDPKSKLPVSVQKRIDKLTAEKHAVRDELDRAKAELATLTAKLQNAPVQTVQVSSTEILPEVRNLNDLAQREAQARAVKKFCMQNPEGGMVKGTDPKTGEPTETFITPERVRELLVNSEELLTEKIPHRRDYLAQNAKSEVEARAYYPQIFTNGSEDGQLAAQFANMAPWIRQFPDWQLAIGHYVTGFKAYQAALKAKAAGPAKKPVPAVKPLGAPKPAAGGTKVPASKKSLHAVIGERNGDVSVDDAASLLGSLF